MNEVRPKRRCKSSWRVRTNPACVIGITTHRVITVPWKSWLNGAMRAALLMSLAALTSFTLLPEPGAAQAETEDATAESEATEGEWAVLPFLAYTPETGLAGGVVAGYYRRLAPEAPTSTFQGTFRATVRGQFSLEWSPDVYLRATRLDGRIEASRFPDVFYGVGPDAAEDDEEDYTSWIIDVAGRGLRELRPGIRLGPEVRLRFEDVADVDEDGILEAGAVTGAEGGTTVGVGLTGTLDTRDNVFSPRRGSYVEASWVVHDGALGSDFDFHRVVLDARRFVPVGERAALGVQGYLEATPGRAPFQLMALLGGSQRLRGYREGRFRDRLYVMGQAEVRFPIWRRFGGVVFGAGGDVARALEHLDVRGLERAGGVGLRYRFTDEGVVLRGDFAVGREGGHLYLTINQAF